MLRVLKPGGTIAFTSWPPHLMTGRAFALMGKYAPPLPPGVSPHDARREDLSGGAFWWPRGPSRNLGCRSARPSVALHARLIRDFEFHTPRRFASRRSPYPPFDEHRVHRLGGCVHRCTSGRIGRRRRHRKRRKPECRSAEWWLDGAWWDGRRVAHRRNERRGSERRCRCGTRRRSERWCTARGYRRDGDGRRCRHGRHCRRDRGLHIGW
jgi:hypothetical protein